MERPSAMLEPAFQCQFIALNDFYSRSPRFATVTFAAIKWANENLKDKTSN